MKNFGWKHFLALFMAIVMVMASGVFVTTQSFKATEDGSYEEDLSEESIDAEEGSEDADSGEASDEGGEETGESSEEDESVEEAASVNVIFDLNGGEGDEPDAYAADVVDDGGVAVGELPQLSDYVDGDGYSHVFVGWSTREDASGPDDSFYYADSDENNELKLYAVWNVEEPAAEEVAEEETAGEAEEAVEEEPAQETDEAVEEEPAEEIQETVEEPAEEIQEAAGEAVEDTNDTVDKSEEVKEETASEPQEEIKEVKDETRDNDQESKETKAAEEASDEQTANETNPETYNQTDEESYLVDEDGKRILDAEGNPVRMDSEGYRIDENGNRILDENGNPINAKDVALVGAEEQATYMTAGYFAQTTSKGVSVNVTYQDNVFPVGTTMVVKDISQEEAVALARKAESSDGKSENAENESEEESSKSSGSITGAIAVDITFLDKDGNEIQPASGVSVSITAPEVIGGTNPTLVHVSDDGDISKVDDASVSGNGAQFSASEFSTYLWYCGTEDRAQKYDNIFQVTMDPSQPLTLRSAIANSDGYYLGGTWQIFPWLEDQQKNREDGIDLWKNKLSVAFTNGDTVVNSSNNTTPAEAEIVATGNTELPTVVTYTYDVNGGRHRDYYVINIGGSSDGYVAHFNVNGGSGSVKDVPVTMTDNGGLVQMPDGSGLSRDNYKLVGWSLAQNAMTDDRRNGWYDKIYDLGDGNDSTTSDAYVWMPNGEKEITFYAMWAKTSHWDKIGFYIRKDGVIQTEPAGYPASEYITVTPGGEYDMDADVCEYITIAKTETNLDKVKNNITAKAWNEVYNEINTRHKDLLETYPGLTTDGEGYYIVWYVIKDQGNRWHIDGCIRGGASQYSLDYNPNCNDFEGQAPAGKPYTAGTEVTVEGNNTLTRTGYSFGGWNTEPDGNGTGYQAGSKITLTENTTLYAQWIANTDTPYTLLCYDAETDTEISNTRKVRYGKTGSTIVADDNDKKLEGYKFVENDERNIKEAAILPDGSTTLKLYFEKTHAVKVYMTNGTKVYDKKPVEAGIEKITVDGNDVTSFKYENDTITFEYNNKTYTINDFKTTITGDNTSVTDSGSYDVSAASTNTDGDGWMVMKGDKETAFTVDVVDGKIVIAKREITIRSKSQEWEYDGQYHKLDEYDVIWTNKPADSQDDSWAEGDSMPGIVFTTGDGVKEPTIGDGTDNSFKIDKLALGDKTEDDLWKEALPNYTITREFGKLKITSDTPSDLSINIIPVDYEGSYDGQEHSGDFTVEGASESEESESIISKIADKLTKTSTKKFVIGEDTYTIKGLRTNATGNCKDAGDYKFSIEGSAEITRNGKKVPEGYCKVNITREGIIKINKIPIELTSASLSKFFDEKELRNPDGNLAVTEEDAKKYGFRIIEGKNGKTEGEFVQGEGIKITFTGAITKPGDTKNTFSYEKTGSTNLENYDISVENGTLTVENTTGKLHVSIRKDGVIPVEPKGHSTGEYTNITYNESSNSFIYDIQVDLRDYFSFDKIQEVNNNDVIRAYWGEDISDALTDSALSKFENWNEKGKEINKKYFWKPGTKVTWYVIKQQKDGKWHINGVVDAKPVLEVTKTLISPDKVVKGKKAKVGDKLKWQVTVKNTGDAAAKNVIVTDELTGDNWTINKLEEDKEESFETAEYTVTEADQENGTVRNTALAQEKDSGVDPVSGGNEVPIKGGDDTALKVEKKLAAITRVMADGTVKTDTSGSAHIGDKITWIISVVNYSNMDAKDVVVKDALTGDTFEVGKIAAKGQSQELTTKPYTVTKEDLDNGKVVNVATVTGNDYNDDPIDEKNLESATNEVPVEQINVTFKSKDAEKDYDGTPLYNQGDLIIEGQLAEGDRVVVKWTGEQTYVGQSPNSFEYRIVRDGIVTSQQDKPVTGKLGLGLGTVLAAEDDSIDVTYKYNVTYDPGTLTVNPLDGKIDPSKVASKSHPDGVYKVGDQVEFTIEAQNIFADARTITITEQEGVTLEGGKSAIAFENVAPGGKVSVKAYYTVKEADIYSDYSNTATVTISDGTTPGGSYPVKDPVNVQTEKAEPSMIVIKTSDSDKKTVKAGDTINYTIQVINNGNVTLSDVKAADELTGDSWTVGDLAVGESKEFTAAYKVTDEDIVSGKVKNTATATAKTPDGKNIDSDGSTENGTNQSFNLVIHYVDENGRTISPDYTGTYQYKSSFVVDSPAIAGYTPTYEVVRSDENGMPAKDVEVTVIYYKNPEPAAPVNNTTNITNITNNTTIEGDSDDGDDDSDSSSGNRSGSSNGNNGSSNSTRNTSNRSSNNSAGNANTGNADNAAQPDIASQDTAAPAATESSPRPQSSSRRPDRQARVTIDENGNPKLVSASDTETPLMNLNLGDHACNILRFLILLAAMAMVIVHTKKMKEHQARIFELTEKLEDAKGRK